MRLLARLAASVVVVAAVTATTAHGWHGPRTTVHTTIRTWGGAAPIAGYGAPVYGSVVYGSPAYGSPVYGSPVYGAPSYGSPSYGCTGGSFGSPMYYGSPMYGAPSYGCTGGNFGYAAPGYGNQAFVDPSGILNWLRFFRELQSGLGGLGGDGSGSNSKLLSRVEALEKKIDALKPSDLLPADYNQFKANTEQALKGINSYLERLDAKLDGIQGRLKVLENKTKDLKEP